MRTVKTIDLALPYRLGRVNCYLIETDTGYILIDTGCRGNRAELERRLENEGCRRGNVHLIALTHGDFDHAGNAAYLHRKFDTRTAMHRDDSGMVERGNMFWNRRKSNILTRISAPILFRFGKSERFKPDLYLEDGDDLSEYGFKARVLQIQGHSRGSIGVLTAGNDLFCGDLLENTSKPRMNPIMDDLEAADRSVGRLMQLGVDIVYPGHGDPFKMAALQDQ